MEEEYTFENPYTSTDDCEDCKTHGTPCLNCAEECNGVDGPGFYEGRRLLLPATTKPNIFRSMVYWWNHHQAEYVSIRLTPLKQPTVPVFDTNIVNLGLIGRGFGGTLGYDTNQDTVYIPVQIAGVDGVVDLRTNQIIPEVKDYYKPRKAPEECMFGICEIPKE